MRIELPQPSWTDAQRAQEDAHTLTLPAQHPHALPASFLGGLAATDVVGGRVAVLDSAPAALVLTF